MARPRVFSIPAGVRFLPTFVAALLDGAIVPGVSRADGPLAPADTTIYVPTRRAARALIAEFARCAEGATTILPKIRPLGAVDEEAVLFAEPDDAAFALDPDLPEAIGEIERRFILAELVLRWSRALRAADEDEAIVVGGTPADALALAGDLAGLIDEFIVEGAPWAAVRNLVADDYDQYWSLTTKFLQIAIEQWPAILKDRDRIDAVDRRARLIEREIARLSAGAPHGPMIVLGSTGTNKATARLMRAIARLDRGAVVLPGLDETMPDSEWDLVAGKDDVPPAWGHPQATLARLLLTLDCSRDAVETLGAPDAPMHARANFVARALAPSESTAGWRFYLEGRAAEVETALAGVTMIEAADEREEALSIALCLREALETDGRTAALVTPDRSIARRVRAELARWGVDVDDSGGENLGVAPAGAFARAALAAAEEASDVARVALLAHRHAAPAHDRIETVRLARLLEIGVLRATAHDANALCRIEEARAKARERFAHPAAARISDDDWREIGILTHATESALAPLVALSGRHAIGRWNKAHRQALAHLAAHADMPATDDDLILERLFDEVAALGDDSPSGMQLTREEYGALFDSLVASAVVRGPQRNHPRLKILGQLEARLLDADLIVLAGLDETIWPPQPRSDAFLNRPMRAQLGLTPPERRIGQSAHDFCMAMGAPDVVLTRAQKRGGSPTVASRFVQRIGALGGAHFDAARVRGQTWRALARAIDHPEKVESIARPAPKPKLDLRPDRLSVTKIETLRRDPYAIYAERILELKPLDALDTEPDASDQGTAVHAVLAQLSERWPFGPLPVAARTSLLQAARAELGSFFDDPAWRAFKWPRVVAGVDYILGYEHARRPHLAAIHGEVEGKTSLTLADGTIFTLSARADRIEIDTDGRARIIDYKTGTPPTAKQVSAGIASQLTLEAAMVVRGGFADIGTHEVETALYLKVGGADGGEEVNIVEKGKTFDDLVKDHWTQLQEMLDSWRDESRGYVSRPLVQYASRFGDYDHLARVKEWSAAGGGSEGDA